MYFHEELFGQPKCGVILFVFFCLSAMDVCMVPAGGDGGDSGGGNSDGGRLW